MDQVECNYSNRKKHYEKLGSAGIKGSLYQIDLLTMVLLNGMRKIKNWRLSTEDKGAAQLDDLIFEHLPLESAILVQAKHKEDEKKQVSYKDLMSVNKNSEFSLAKYFFSYQEVKDKFKVQNVGICTNLKLDENTKSILEKETVDPDSVLHFEGAENICYVFSSNALPELKQNIKMYHATYGKNKEISISDDDINDFLKHLKIFPNCLGEKNVDKVMQQTISRIKFSENLNAKVIQTEIRKKMTDWFKEKKGRYLTEVEAKAFFCDIRSNKYCEHLMLYDICFKRNNLPLILQSDASAKNPKRFLHIIPDKQYVLNVIKIYHALPTNPNETTLFVNPEETIEVQRQMIDAFEVPHYTILVMVCPNRIEETIARAMCDKMVEILDTYKYKNLILIADERNNLAIHANIDEYTVITDQITFEDIEETTQEEFKLRKFINFQGSTMSLEELFTSPAEADLNQIVTSEMLLKLAQGGKIGIGLELPHPDNYYINRSFIRNEMNIPEGDLWHSTELNKAKVILISDSAGMGKSSVLTSLGVSIKNENPHLWVIRFDLGNYTNIMRTTLDEGRNSVSILEMLNSQKTSKLKGEFGQKLFATPNRVVIMLDGVDEVSPTYTELVINLIRDSLVQVNLAKIFVTTRPHMSKDLGEILKLQSFTLKPFSKLNQIKFLKKYWTENLDLQDGERKIKCNVFAEALIENISKWINEKHQNNFAGIPLQTRMLAEIFQEKNDTNDEEHDWEGCKEFSSSNNKEPKLPTKIDITQLYKLFIDKKCDIYIKKNNPSRHLAADEALKLQLKECEKFHRALALKEIIQADKRLQFFSCYTNVEWPIPSAFANNFLFRVGIVQAQGGNIEFLHRTFAEFFVFECLLIELEREPVNTALQEFFMNSLLIRKEFYMIRAFVDSRMQTVLHLIENNFCSYFRKNCIPDWLLAVKFHVLAEEGRGRMFKCLIGCIDKEQREILSKTVTNLVLMERAFTFAIQYGHLNILKLLLELNETFNKGKDAHKEFLRYAAMQAIQFNLDAFKFLLRQVDKHGKNIFGRTPLHEAAFICQFEVVKSLVENSKADINTKDDVLGWTAFHEAAFMGRLEIVKFLVEEVRADINVKDIQNETALHYTAFWGKLEIVQYLVEVPGVDINIKNKYGETAVHRAVYRGELEIVKCLVERTGADINLKNNNGETALHLIIASRGNLAIVKYLVETAGVDVDVKNKYGETALHRAAYQGELEIVKCLVEGAGADINAKSNNGETALHLTASSGSLGIAKYLVGKAGAEINIKNNKGDTALHLAAYWDKLEVVKYLVGEVEADINAKNGDGETALFGAASRDRLEIVKYLVEEAGADVNVKNKDGETPLYGAASRDRLEIVKYLVAEAGVDINVINNDGWTALRVAEYRNWRIVGNFLSNFCSK